MVGLLEAASSLGRGAGRRALLAALRAVVQRHLSQLRVRLSGRARELERAVPELVLPPEASALLAAASTAAAAPPARRTAGLRHAPAQPCALTSLPLEAPLGLAGLGALEQELESRLGAAGGLAHAESLKRLAAEVGAHIARRDTAVAGGERAGADAAAPAPAAATEAGRGWGARRRAKAAAAAEVRSEPGPAHALGGRPGPEGRPVSRLLTRPAAGGVAGVLAGEEEEPLSPASFAELTRLAPPRAQP